MKRQHIEKELIKTFKDGETIFSEGDDSNEMFIIQDGAVVASAEVNGEDVILGTITRGEFFGEMAMLEGKPRSATCRALGKTQVLTLKTGSFLMRLRRDPTFAFEMIQKLCGRLRQLNDRYKTLVAERQDSTEALDLILKQSSFSDLDDADAVSLAENIQTIMKQSDGFGGASPDPKNLAEHEAVDEAKAHAN